MAGLRLRRPSAGRCAALLLLALAAPARVCLSSAPFHDTNDELYAPAYLALYPQLLANFTSEQFIDPAAPPRVSGSACVVFHLWGPDAFAVALGSGFSRLPNQGVGAPLPVVAASSFGDGRVVAFGNSELLQDGCCGTDNIDRLVINAARWAGRADAGPRTVAASSRRFERLLTMLTAPEMGFVIDTSRSVDGVWPPSRAADWLPDLYIWEAALGGEGPDALTGQDGAALLGRMANGTGLLLTVSDRPAVDDLSGEPLNGLLWQMGLALSPKFKHLGFLPAMGSLVGDAFVPLANPSYLMYNAWMAMDRAAAGYTETVPPGSLPPLYNATAAEFDPVINAALRSLIQDLPPRGTQPWEDDVWPPLLRLAYSAPPLLDPLEVDLLQGPPNVVVRVALEQKFGPLPDPVPEESPVPVPAPQPEQQPPPFESVPPPDPFGPLEFRLSAGAGGGGVFYGRLEYRIPDDGGSGTWATVCSAGFTPRAARAACDAMGYAGGVAVPFPAPEGAACVAPGSPIVRLDGSGPPVPEPPGSDLCTHADDVWLMCGTAVCTVPPPSPPSAQDFTLPLSLVPDVAHFDAACSECFGEEDGSISSWRDKSYSSQVLEVYGVCDRSDGMSLGLDGLSCFALLPTPLRNWAKPVGGGPTTEAFTLVIVYRRAGAGARRPGALVHINRTPQNYNNELVWNTDESFIFSEGRFAQTDTLTAGPTDTWVMETMIRQDDGQIKILRKWGYAEQVFQFNGDDDVLAGGQPLIVGADNLVLGADFRDDSRYTLGRIGAFFAYGRELSAPDLATLYALLNKRFLFEPNPPVVLPPELIPDVVEFDAACSACFVTSAPDNATAGAGGGDLPAIPQPSAQATTTWVDPSDPTQMLVLEGNCTRGLTSVAFDGLGALARMPQGLPLARWQTASPVSGSAPATGAFTLVMAYRAPAAALFGPPMALLQLNRSRANFDGGLAWMTEQGSFIYGQGVFVPADMSSLTPVADAWVMEALVRTADLTMTGYRRSAGQLQRFPFGQEGQAVVEIGAYDLTIGGNQRDDTEYLQGEVGVLLVYSRALAEAELEELYARYNPRYEFEPGYVGAPTPPPAPSPGGQPEPGYEPGDVRLGDPRPISDTEVVGRVEVFYANSWGTVCDDRFEDADAQVVCRQLGGSGGSVFAPEWDGSGPESSNIWLDELACDPAVHTRISQCLLPGFTWGDTDCLHYEDVWVKCTVPSSAPPPPQVSPPAYGGAPTTADRASTNLRRN